jgi:N-acetyl-alpha-D-muramate 1-phosphate uridylyltransferase
MRAMILAAGRGERMRPLTLIVWHIEALVAAGICELVINHAWLGAQLEAAIGDGSRWGAQIRWSAEPEALETAGGIVQALPLLTENQSAETPFAVLNGDVWTDYDRHRLPQIARQVVARELDAWCILVPNPAHHPGGDFLLAADRLVPEDPDGQAQRLTFSGLGVYTPRLFAGLVAGTRAALAPQLRTRRAGGECHEGAWVDVGTPERLIELDTRLADRLESPFHPSEAS